ncbi:MAG: toll/interleukin-1 receptor domain-containing protein [Bacteroidota bacterium]
MSDEIIPVSVFTSYAHKDEALREELDVHLAMVKRDPAVQIWNDRDIQPGAEWDDSIKSELNTADIILLLVSPRFLASRYIFEVEIKTALERHEKKEAIVVPIILKKCDWEDTEFHKLQALPRDAFPVVKWDDMDEAFVNVVEGIKKVIEVVQTRKKNNA